MTKPSKQKLSVAICASLIGKAVGEIQLFPAGPFRAQDGRPTDVPHWFITKETVDRINASNRVNRFIIDYEHQTLLAKDNGQAAPKAGTFRNLVWRENGVYADDVVWTNRATNYISDDEYSHISPVFIYNTSTGEILDITMAAITNDPAIDGMSEVLVQAAASLGFSQSNLNKHVNQESVMDEELLAALGLHKNATASEAIIAATALATKAKTADEAATALAAATAEVSALKTESESPDPAKFVPVEAVTELQTQVAALTSQAQSNQVNDLIEPALADGRLLPALEEWARDLGETNVAALTAYLDNAKTIAGLKTTQTKVTTLPDSESQISEPEQSIAAACGITLEQFTAAKKMEAA